MIFLILFALGKFLVEFCSFIFSAISQIIKLKIFFLINLNKKINRKNRLIILVVIILTKMSL